MHGRTLRIIIPVLVISTCRINLSDAQPLQGTDCPDPQNFPDFPENFTRLCVPIWAFNRTYSASTTAPIATALNQLEADGYTDDEGEGTTAVALEKIIDHFEREYKRLAQLFRSDDATPLQDQFRKKPQSTCNIPREESPIGAVNVKISEHGWGKFASSDAPKKLCTTELSADTNVVRNTPVRDMRQFLRALQAVSGKVMRTSGYLWKNPRTFMNFSYLAAPTRCELLHFTAFRVRGKWGVNAGYTNDYTQLFLNDYSRQYLVEQLTVTNRTISTVPMTIRKEPTADKPYNKSERFDTPFVPNTSTLIMRWGGVPVTSLFKSTLNTANNPAIKAALGMVSQTVEQIEGSSTISEIAILIAPIALTALPVALFVDVNTRAIVAYTIATDVLTVLPLFIKGIELLSFEAENPEAVVTWFYGGKRDVENVMGAESWYASCTATKHVRILGSSFICIAISAMVSGIVFELVAKRYTDRRRVSATGIGMQMQPNKQMWRNSNTVACKECKCIHSIP